MIALLLVAAALGLSNLAAAIGIGVSGGVSGRLRLRVAVVFGAFEAGMPVLGLLLGRGLASGLGGTTRWIGGGLLIAVGLYTLREARRSSDSPAPEPGAARAAVPQGQPAQGRLAQGRLAQGRLAVSGLAQGQLALWRLVVSGLALSVDNLAAGFALGTYRVPLAVAAIVIGLVSVLMSLAGLELGGRAARTAGLAGRRGGLLAGTILLAVGIAITAGLG